MKQKQTPKKVLALAPDYYSAFRCIGSACEETCCAGWQVSIDEATFKCYQACQNEELAPRLRQDVIENSSAENRNPNNAAHMRLTPDGRCAFLQIDNLCSIQRVIGESALSDTCSSFPRHVNLFGGQPEYSLGIACPEAARLVLLHPEPISFTLIAPDAELTRRKFVSGRFPQNGEGHPAQMTVLNDFRALIIGLLQQRASSLSARLMVLGFLLEDVIKATSSANYRHASQLTPVLQGYAELASRPELMENQFCQIEGNLPRKLRNISNVLVQYLAERTTPRMLECLLAASNGLLASQSDEQIEDATIVERYRSAYQQYYLPYFNDKSYILENYLVNQVLTRMFPFAAGEFLDLYRELVCNLAIVQVLLVGMAAHHQRLDDRLVIQLLQSFVRKTNHNPTYLERLLRAIGAQGQGAFVDVMWMLKEV